MSTTYDLDRMFGEWIDSTDTIAEPPTLLPQVFSITRSTRQRRGLLGRLQVALSTEGVLSTSLRPALTYALLIALLVAMMFAVAFAAGLLQPPIATGWRTLESDDPLTTYVSQVRGTSNGFVAIGSSQVVNTDCATGEDRGRVWTSTDGNAWTDRPNELISKLVPQDMVTVGQWTYVAGSDVVCYDENGAGEDPAFKVLRSVDGVGWELLPLPEEVFQWGNVPLVAELDDEFVAIGPYQELLPSGEYTLGNPVVWASVDGVTWERRASLEGIQYVAGLAQKGGTLVALAGFESEPRMVVMTSTDGGVTWDTQDLPQGVPSSVNFLVADDQRFVAAGDDAAIASTDGKAWTAASVDDGNLNGVVGLYAVPGGYLATREDRADDATVDVCQEVVGPAVPIPSGSVPEFTPNPSPVMTCLPVALSGGTSFSRDGITWTSGPDLPRSTAGGQYVVTVGERGLVASDSSRPAEVWYSPLEPFLTSD